MSKQAPFREFRVSERYRFTEIVSWLADSQYERVEMVLEPSDFAVRGSIIDIFPVNHAQPVRLEFFGDELERLAGFDVHTQLSLTSLERTQVQLNSKIWRMARELRSNDAGDAHLIASLAEGDFVVHYLHGIGVYNGLKHETFLGREGEYLEIKYKGNDRILVPIDQIKYVKPYRGAPNPTLNSLSDDGWKKATDKVKKATAELAEEIFILYKIRSQIQGTAFPAESDTLRRVSDDFPYTETPDQLTAIADVKKDLESAWPMDRLVCGDVGFGKTEIAIRAAYKVAHAGRQVVIIAPTTLLADQHFHVFRERLSAYGVNVGMLSRLVDPKRQKQILSLLATGKLDVLIGTHRVLSADVKFKDLGLLVVDEEQRFGVGHKEKIKQLKSHVDTLTLSATPIPRTLYMALTGARDLSQIKSPPQGRKPVITQVSAHSDEKIRAAIESELARDGQVFYVFNNINRMPAKLAKLQKLVPNARIMMAHGRMDAEHLELVMDQFFNREADILLCTTIVENGIDIANVNTIIIDEVQNLGLSQIHQLRGRVGRSDRQAYAWMFFPSEALLSADAKDRILAIKTYTALGAGYDIALKDLEIRGAGTLLGKKQHGYMSSVGFDLYCKILDESVQVVRGEKQAKTAEFELKFPRSVKAMLPNEYVGNAKQRLALYYRLTDCKTLQEVQALKAELMDRFGPVPPSVISLLDALIKQFPNIDAT